MPSPDSLRIITVIFLTLFLVMGLRKPIWAVIAYLILVYCKVSFYYPFFATIKAELVFAVLILIRLFVAGNSLNKLSPNYNPVNKYLFSFTGCILLSFVFALDWQHSWDEAVYHFIKVLILYIMLLLAVTGKKEVYIFIWSFVFLFCYLAYEPTYGYLTGTGADEHLYGSNYTADVGILSGHVALANNMNQMLPIAFFLFLAVKNKKLKLLSAIPMIVFFIGLIGSGSRGGVIGFFIFSATLVYFSKNRARNAIVLSVLLMLIFGVSSQFKSTGERISAGSVEGRLIGLIHGIEMLRVKGHIFGVGPGCFQVARGRYFGYTMQSHNIFGEVIGDLGIPGTIAWVLFISGIFKNLIAAKKKLATLSMQNSFIYYLTMGLQVSLVVRLAISFASHGLYYFYWYVIAALSIVVRKLADGIPDNQPADG